MRNRQGKNFAANALKLRCPFVRLCDFAGGSDGVDEPVARIVGTDEELAQYIAAFVFRQLEFVCKKFDGFNRVMLERNLS